MKTKVLMLAVILAGFTACNAQDKGNKSISKSEAEQNAPKGSWKVNREFDENGNLISYDSTYVYSNVEGDTISNPNMNEMVKNFRQFFERNGMKDQSAFFDSFMNDSLSGNQDFFQNDFFRNQMMAHDFQDQIRKMDSVQREFLKQNYPQMFQNDRQKIIPREEEESWHGTI